jgi:hypothetical protein
MLFGFQKKKLVYVFESQVYVHCCLVGVSCGLENVVEVKLATDTFLFPWESW